MTHRTWSSIWDVPYCFSRSSIKFQGQTGQNKANLRNLIAATGLVILLKLDSNRRFSARVTLKFDGWHRKIIGHLFYITPTFVHHLKPLGEFKLVLLSGNAQFGSKSAIFLSRVTLKNNRVPLLCYVKLCASFQSHRGIQTGVTVRKRSIWVKIDDFFVSCDLQIWWMTLKNNRAPLQCRFKLCASFHSHRWIQTKVTVPKRSIRVKIGDFFVPCDLEIWWMSLKNNRAPLLCYFKLCTSFHSHWWIQTGVTVRKRPIWLKIVLLAVWPSLWPIAVWPWKTIRHLS